MIKQGFILAAGLGNRMRPLTDERPKPMVMVQGRPIIAYALDAFVAHGIQDCVINTHYKSQVLEDYLKTRTDLNIILSPEPQLLDTGGGIQQGLKHLNPNAPVLIASGDSIWQNPKTTTTLKQMEAAWNPKIMDMLLLLQPLQTMGDDGVGDYNILPNAQAQRSLTKSGTHMWTSLRILNPNIMDLTAPPAPFSFLQTLDTCEANNRLHAISHTGIWHHLSTPHDINTLNQSPML